jgi:hypothetical protein
VHEYHLPEAPETEKLTLERAPAEAMGNNCDLIADRDNSMHSHAKARVEYSRILYLIDGVTE